MSFAKRVISLQFQDGGESVNLDGLRSTAIISNLGTVAAMLQLKVYGMTLAQMNAYSSIGASLVASDALTITVNAGNENEALAQVFKGTIRASYIDLGSMPDVSFSCSANTGFLNKGSPASPTQSNGIKTAQGMIASLAALAGLAVDDSTTKPINLSNQYLYGSLIDQITQVARIAAIPIDIANGKVALWDNMGNRSGELIELNPQNGLIGYPSYWEAGFNVKSEFNPDLTAGRQVNLTSGLTKANGVHSIINVIHEISTLSPDGAWFSTAKLSSLPFMAQN